MTKITPYKVFGRLRDDLIQARRRQAYERRQGTKSREWDRRPCGGLWGIRLEGHGSDGRFWCEELAGPTNGRVGACVCRAGKRVEPLLGGCFGGGVKDNKASGIAAETGPGEPPGTRANGTSVSPVQSSRTQSQSCDSAANLPQEPQPCLPERCICLHMWHARRARFDVLGVVRRVLNLRV